MTRKDWIWLMVIVLGMVALFFGLKEAILPPIPEMQG